ncbi:HAD family hydrolase [Roseivirga misakiensis]|uniref:phosphoglycolate phosphatase n=1 Tax=Roseivirga misakiensis TaxID=1563681 RepID=A0A1E5T1G7_9BACT|nr:HAD hydrolase-like protein [Roseivirga misakiensis]OEK05209.1 hypothetical protein BFP71_17550 [Roseivirga misakiensis]
MMKSIFWDFDGVILDSMSVRDQGFIEVLKPYPEEQVAFLLDFHRRNGGWSRYVKFRYFFEQIRGESVSEETVNEMAQHFSVIMKRILTNKELLIQDALNFIKKYHKDISMHIVSGSDHVELNYLCAQLEIDLLFQSIDGSPTPKAELVGNLLNTRHYPKHEVVLVGDSINDYEAASKNEIGFIGYNNLTLEEGHAYVKAFNDYDLKKIETLFKSA